MKNIMDLKPIADFQDFIKNYKQYDKIKISTKILKHLKNSEIIAATGCHLIDEIDNKETNIEILAYSDGEYIWDSRDIYYYENYGMSLNNDFVMAIK